jgi:hypothetical protein
MAWGSVITDTGIITSVNGPYHDLAPNEGAHVHFTRTAGTGDVILQIFASIDGGTTLPDQPAWTVLMDAADDEKSFPISGGLPVRSIAAGVDGAGATFTAKFVLNGGLVA